MNGLRTRRRSVGGESLPYDAEIGYLESVGNCTIDTGYVPQGNDIRILTKIMYNGYTASSSWIPWFHTYVSEQTNTYRIIRTQNKNSQVLIYNGTQAGSGGIDFDVSIGGIYNIDFNRNSYNINGVTGNFSNPKGSENTAPLKLFSTEFKGRFYSFSVFKNDVLVLDLIPVRVGQVGYMYDKVSKQLFGNSGTGSFILGPDKVVELPSGYKQLEYIKSNGTQYIDTGYVPNVNTEIKIDFSIVTSQSDAYIFHSEDGNRARISLGITQNRGYFGSLNNQNTDSVGLPAFITDAKYDITLNKDKVIVNGIEYYFAHTYVTIPTMYSMGLFGSRRGTLLCKGTVKSFSCYENNVLKINLIPCRRNSDNVLGMYDLVNNTFYTNVGTGDFIAGPEV